jgi:hypothetical protein
MVGLLAPASAGAAGWSRAVKLTPVDPRPGLGAPSVAVSGDGEAVAGRPANGTAAVAWTGARDALNSSTAAAPGSCAPSRRAACG